MEAVIASIFRSWFDKLTTNGRYIEAFIFAVRLTISFQEKSMFTRFSKFRHIILFSVVAALSVIMANCSSSNSGSGSSEKLRIYETIAGSGSFSSVADDSTGASFQLSLVNVSKDVLWFSDRPGQDAGYDNLNNVITNIWPRVYGSVAPNALLKGTTSDQGTIEIFCVLNKPVYNASTGQLDFIVTYLDGNQKPTSNLAITDVKLIIINNATTQAEEWSQLLVGDTGTFEPTTTAGTYTFRIQKTIGDVLSYSSAPTRKMSRITVKDFIQNWQSQFGAVPPNVSIAFDPQNNNIGGGVQIATLTNPVYDEAVGSLSFTAKILSGTMPITSGMKVNAPSLFIDAGSKETTDIIPNPVVDPEGKYFQVMIKAPETADNEAHLIVNANEMLLKDTPPYTKTDIFNATWLTGGPKVIGGKTVFTDWENPQFQILDSATKSSATGAVFADTYDIPLKDLPKYGTTDYRILKIPYRKPDDPARSLAGSGRITVRMGGKVWAQSQKDGNGRFTIATPSLDPAASGAGGLDRFDFFELNCANGEVKDEKKICFVNSSNVDMFAFGVTYKGLQSKDTNGTPSLYFGVDPGKSDAVKNIITELKALTHVDYSSGLVTNNGNFVRFLGPNYNLNQKNGGKYEKKANDANALDAAITKGYDTYKKKDNKNNSLIFKVQKTEYQANTVTKDNIDYLVFDKPTGISLEIQKPKSWEVFAAKGVLDVAGKTAVVQDALKFVTAYLNRGVFHDVEKWYKFEDWCKEPGVPFNEYANILHKHYLNNAAYAISFDDVLALKDGTAVKQSEPACGECRAMSLLLTP